MRWKARGGSRRVLEARTRGARPNWAEVPPESALFSGALRWVSGELCTNRLPLLRRDTDDDAIRKLVPLFRPVRRCLCDSRVSDLVLFCAWQLAELAQLPANL